jgi:hypothetical protein
MGLQKGRFRLKLETPEGLFLLGSIRESLEKAMNSGGKVASDDPYLSDNSLYEGNIPADLAQNHDKYLYGD